MVPTPEANPPKVLLIGVGDVTVRVAHLLATAPTPVELVLASRSLERATRFANLTKFAAMNVGAVRDIAAVGLDIADVARTAEAIRGLDPSLIFLGASIQPARAIMDLPDELFRQLDEAQLGPWLPMHLTLAYELMQAVRLAESRAVVVNSAYPDAVGPALASIGLTPHIGIGNVGNVIPGITCAAAHQLGTEPGEVSVNLVGHHYFSHHVHRFGEAEGIPHSLQVRVRGQRQPVDTAAVYAQLASNFRRQGGRDGQQLTAASATSIILALLGEQPVAVHAPAPDGLVGGYPVRISSHGVDLDLPPELTAAQAQSINQRCQQLDGIQTMASGTIRFTPERMAIMERALGYSCHELEVAEARAAAEELSARYDAFLLARGLDRR